MDVRDEPAHARPARRGLVHVRGAGDDAAGNVDATPASFTFTVDTTPANTTITSAPPAASSSTGAGFSFTASDAGPGFECRLDGAAFAGLLEPAVVQRPDRDVAHVRGSRRGRRRQRRCDAGDAHLDGRPDRAEHLSPLDAGQPEREPDADLRPRLDRVSVHVRVRSRRRRLVGLHDALHDAVTRRRLAHAEGARDRRCREHRRHGGHLHVARRRNRADRLDHGAGERRRRRRDASCSRATPPTPAAPASPPWSSSARRRASAPGRARRRAGTRPPRSTATTTSAS